LKTHTYETRSEKRVEHFRQAEKYSTLRLQPAPRSGTTMGSPALAALTEFFVEQRGARRVGAEVEANLKVVGCCASDALQPRRYNSSGKQDVDRG
jgi:hypothetical protein